MKDSGCAKMFELLRMDEKNRPSDSFDCTEAKTVVATSNPLFLLLCFTIGETEAARVNSPKFAELGRGRSKTRILVAGYLVRLSPSGVTVRGTWDTNWKHRCLPLFPPPLRWTTAAQPPRQGDIRSFSRPPMEGQASREYSQTTGVPSLIDWGIT